MFLGSCRRALRQVSSVIKDWRLLPPFPRTSNRALAPNPTVRRRGFFVFVVMGNRFRQHRIRLLAGSYIGLNDASAGILSPATSMLNSPAEGSGALVVST